MSKNYELFEKVLEKMGSEELLQAFVQAMDEQELNENLEFIIRTQELTFGYVLTRDGKEVFRGEDEMECLEYLQKKTPYSWEHAFKHEGWAIEPLTE